MDCCSRNNSCKPASCDMLRLSSNLLRVVALQNLYFLRSPTHLSVSGCGKDRQGELIQGTFGPTAAVVICWSNLFLDEGHPWLMIFTWCFYTSRKSQKSLKTTKKHTHSWNRNLAIPFFVPLSLGASTSLWKCFAHAGHLSHFFFSIIGHSEIAKWWVPSGKTWKHVYIY